MTQFAKIRRRVSTIALTVVLLGGCAGTPDTIESALANRPQLCRSGETFSCVERMREPVRCFCADRDTLRDLLEPVTTY